MSVEDVSRLLISLKLTNYCSVFEEYQVDGLTLMNCYTVDDLIDLGIVVIAKARLLLIEIVKLKKLAIENSDLTYDLSELTYDTQKNEESNI